jgi:hypothetical protein
MAGNEDEYAVLCLIEKYKNLKEYRISHAEFVVVLGRSQRNVVDLLNRMEEHNI